ncbi:hypothetical protein [Persicirhabdus sediminis]|nr:hypothetical protein [Persicirhabdus sediminis]
MLHKITAAIMLWIMALMVTVAQPGVSYCLCAEALIIGECDCREPAAAPSSCESGCHDCSAPAQLDEFKSSQPSPCKDDDCILELEMDVGLYPAAYGANDWGKNPLTHLAIIGQSAEADWSIQAPHILVDAQRTRGSPLDELACNPVPIFIWNSVYRL